MGILHVFILLNAKYVVKRNPLPLAELLAGKNFFVFEIDGLLEERIPLRTRAGELQLHRGLDSLSA